MSVKTWFCVGSLGTVTRTTVLAVVPAWISGLGTVTLMVTVLAFSLPGASWMLVGETLVGQPGVVVAVIVTVVVMLPVLIVYFLTQRYFVEGISLTGVKG